VLISTKAPLSLPRALQHQCSVSGDSGPRAPSLVSPFDPDRLRTEPFARGSLPSSIDGDRARACTSTCVPSDFDSEVQQIPLAIIKRRGLRNSVLSGGCQVETLVEARTSRTRHVGRIRRLTVRIPQCEPLALPKDSHRWSKQSTTAETKRTSHTFCTAYVGRYSPVAPGMYFAIGPEPSSKASRLESRIQRQ